MKIFFYIQWPLIEYSHCAVKASSKEYRSYVEPSDRVGNEYYMIEYKNFFHEIC